MANPAPENDEVKGEELLERGFSAFFNKLGDLIHGAAKKDTTETHGKATLKETSSETPNDDKKKVIETSAQEVK